MAIPRPPWADDGEGRPANSQPDMSGSATIARPAWASKSKDPAWQMGGQRGDTRNKWETEPFLESMRKQRDEERQKMDADRAYQGKMYQRRDFTGFVTWNQRFPDAGENGQSTFKVGDVFENGQKLGNLYEDFGYSDEEANTILGPQVLGGQDWGRALKDTGADPDKMKAAIFQRAAKTGRSVEGAFTQRGYEGRVENTKEDIDDWGWIGAGLTTAVASAGVGAVAGSVVAPGPGTLIGAGLAFVAGFGIGALNRDEWIDQVSRATVRAAVGNEQFGEWNPNVVGQVMQDAGGIMLNAGPAKSLLHGLVDLTQDGVGDNRVSFYDNEQAPIMKVAEAGTMFIDAAGIVNPIGMVAYTAGISSLVAGKSIVLGADTLGVNDAAGWDESTGEFHRYQGGEIWGAAVSAGIDTAQMLMPFALGRVARGFGVTASGVKTRVLGDRYFRVNASGQKEVLKGLTFLHAVSAPSTLAGWAGVRVQAGRIASSRVGRGQSTPITGDDLYKAAVQLQNQAIPFKLMLINGIGEGVEEVAQTFAENASLGYTDQNLSTGVVEAFIGGFSAGAGMTAGSRLTRRNVALDTINLQKTIDGEPLWTPEQYDSATIPERQAASRMSPAGRAVAGFARERVIRSLEQDQLKYNVLLDRQHDAMTLASTAELHHLPGAPAEGMYAVMFHQSVDIPEHAVVSAIQTMRDLMSDRAILFAREEVDAELAITETESIIDGLTKKISLSQDPAFTAELQGTLDKALTKLGDLQQAGSEAEVTKGIHAWILAVTSEFNTQWLEGGQSDPAILDGLNEFFEGIWNGVTEWEGLQGPLAPPESLDKNALMKAAGIIISRIPNDQEGSFQLLMPRVSESMSRTHVDSNGNWTDAKRVMSVARSLGKPQSVDNDGDQEKAQVRARFRSNKAWQAARRGDQFVGVGGIFIDDRKNDLETRREATANYHDSTDLKAQLRAWQLLGHYNTKTKKATVGTLEQKLKALLGKRADRVVSQYVKDIRDGDPDAKARFYLDLAALPGVLLDLGNSTIEYKGKTIVRPNASLLVENLIQTELRDYRAEEARLAVIAVSEKAGFVSEPQQAAPDAAPQRQLPGATYGQSVMQGNQTDTPFRAAGTNAWSTYNSATLGALGYTHPVVQWTIELYTKLTQNRVESASTQLLGSSNLALSQAREDLMVLTESFGPTGMPLEAAAFIVGGWPAAAIMKPESFGTNDTYDHQKNKTMTINQWLLQRAANGRIAELSVPKEDLPSNLTLYANADMKTAALEMFSATDYWRLVGEDLAREFGFLNMTVGEVVRRYNGESDRSNFRKSMRSVLGNYDSSLTNGYPYEPTDDVSTWQVLLDLIRDVSDNTLAHGSDGVAIGTKAKKNKDKHQATLRALGGIRQVLEESRKTFNIEADLSLAALRKDGTKHMKRLLDRNRDVFGALYDALPLEMRATIGAQGTAPIWFYEMMLAEPEEGAMIYFRETLKFEIYKMRARDPEGTGAVYDNQWLNVLQDISAMGELDFFLDNLEQKNTVPDFEKWTNERYGHHFAPLLAYETDATYYSPDASKGGWSWNRGDTERTESLMRLENAAQARAKNLRHEKKTWDEGDNIFMSNPTATHKRMVAQQLKRNADLAAAVFGPRQRQLAVIALAESKDAGNAKKVSSPSTVSAGNVAVLEGNIDFASPIENLLALGTAVDADALAFNPSRLRGKLTIQTREGTTIYWDPRTGDGFYELAKADGGYWRPFLKSLLTQYVYEETPSGGIQRQSIGDDSFQGLITGNKYKNLWTSSTFAAAEEMISLADVDGKVTLYMAHLAIDRTGASLKQLDSKGVDYRRIVMDTFTALKEVGRMSDTELSDWAGMTEDLEWFNVAKMSLTGKDRAIELVNNAKKAAEAAAIARKLAKKKSSGQREIDISARLDLEAWIAGEQSIANNVKEYVEARTKIDWTPGNETIRDAMRSNLVGYVEFHPEALNNVGYDEYDKVSRLFSSTHRDRWGYAYIGTGFDSEENQEAWAALGRTVQSSYLAEGQTNSSLIKTGTMTLGGEGEAMFMTPSYTHLPRMLIEIAPRMHKIWNTTFVNDKGEVPFRSSGNFVEAVGRIDRSIDVENSMGPFTSDLSLQHIEAERVMGSAGINAQISRVGMLFNKFKTQMQAAERTRVIPQKATAELTATITVQKVAVKGKKTKFVPRIDGGLAPYAKNLMGGTNALLNGAGVKVSTNRTLTDPSNPNSYTDQTGPKVTYTTTEEGKRVPKTIMLRGVTRPYTNPGQRKSTEPLWESTSLPLIEQAVERLQFPDDAEDITLSLEWLDPYAKTPELANNMFVDGVLGEHGYDSAHDIIGSFLFGPNGYNPQQTIIALTSRKGGTKAINALAEGAVTQDPTLFADPKNLRLVIETLTDQIMQADHGKGAPDSSQYRGALRMVRDSFAVVGTGADGSTVMLSTEQVLTDPSLVDALQDAKIFPLSAKTVNTLHGGNDTFSHALPMEQVSGLLGEFETWKGVYTPSKVAAFTALQSGTFEEVPKESFMQSRVITAGSGRRRGSDISRDIRILRKQSSLTGTVRRAKEAVHVERVQQNSSSDWRGINRRNLQDIQITLGAAITAQARLDPTAIAGIDTRSRFPSEAAGTLQLSVNLEAVAAFLENVGGILWIHTEDTDTQTSRRTRGFLNSETLHVEELATGSVPIDDIVAVRLRDFPGVGQLWESRVRSVLHSYASEGYNIIVDYDGPDGAEFARHELEAMGYESRNGWLFTPLNARQSFQNADARLSSLSRIDVTMPGEVTPMGLSRDIGDEELLLYDERVKLELSPSLQDGVVPITGVDGFGLPSPAQVPLALARLERLLRPEGLFLTAFQQAVADGQYVSEDYPELLEEFRTGGKRAEVLVLQGQELAPFLQAALDNLTVEGELAAGSTIRLGTIFPMMDSYDNMYLMRHGLAYPRFRREQENTMVVGEKTAISISGTKLLSTELGTAVTGTLARTERIGPFGMNILVTQPTGVIAAKIMEAEYPLKGRALSMQESDFHVTKNEILPGLKMAFYRSEQNNDEKGGAAGTVRGAREGLHAFGLDAVGYLAEGFGFELEVTGSFRKVTQALYTQASKEDKALIREKVLTFLSTSTESKITNEDEVLALMQVAANPARETWDSTSLAPGLQAIQMTSDTLTPAQKYARMAQVYMRHTKARTWHVLGVPGLSTQSSTSSVQSFKIPDMVARVIDSNRDLSATIRADIAARLGPEWSMNHNWQLVSDDSESGQTRVITFKGMRLDSTGSDHTALLQQRYEGRSSDTGSTQQAVIALSAGINSGYEIKPTKIDGVLREVQGEGFSTIEGQRALLVGSVNKALAGRTATYRVPGHPEMVYRKVAEMQAAQLDAYLDTSNWEPGEVEEFIKEAGEILLWMGFSTPLPYMPIIHAWIRARAGALHEKDGEGAHAGPVSRFRAMGFLSDMRKSLAEGRWPTEGGRIPWMTADAVSVVARDSKWVPAGVSTELTGPARRTALLDSAFLLFQSDKNGVEQQFIRAGDGMLRSFDGVFRDKLLTPTTSSGEVMGLLMDPDFERLVSSIDPNTLASLKSLATSEQDEDLIRRIFGGTFTASGFEGWAAPNTARARVEAKAAKTAADKDALHRQTSKEVFTDGRVYRGFVNTQLVFWRLYKKSGAIQGLANLFLPFWNPIDKAHRSGVAAIADWLGGDSIRKPLPPKLEASVAGRIAALEDWKRTQAEDHPRLWDSWLSVREAFLGNIKPYMTREQRQRLYNLTKRIYSSPDWRGIVNEQQRHRIQIESGSTKAEHGMDVILNFLSQTQAPFRRLYNEVEAKAFMQAVFKVARRDDYPVEDVLRALDESPGSFMDNYFTLFVAGLEEIEKMKGLDTPITSVLYTGVLEPLSKNGFFPLNFAANFLQGLTIFHNFWSTSINHYAGLQAVNALLAIFFQGRNAGAVWGKTRAVLAGRPEEAQKWGINIMDDVIGQADMYDLFLRSGVSFTALFGAGLTVGSWALTGEDDEDRRRRRADLHGGLGEWHDPADLINDFRHYNSIYVDNISVLDTMFEVEGTGRSPVDLHWTAKFFLSPMMGMADFLDSGNPAYLFEGFKDGIGSMPLVDNMLWQDAVDTSTSLLVASNAAMMTEEDEANIAHPQNLLFQAVMQMERVMFENSFLNQLVEEGDTYYRNPWVLPEINDTGVVQRNEFNEPMGTEAMETYIDPATGDIREGYVSRTYEDGYMRAVTSRRQTLAFFMNLVTGFAEPGRKGFGTQGSYFRKDMVMDTDTIAKNELTQEEAEVLILSVWDPENYREVLTRDGAERLMMSLHAGTLKVTDPAMENVFIDGDMRAAVAESLRTRIYVEGITDLDLTPEEAERRMNKIWNGYAGNTHAIPLSDVVWGNGDFAGANGISWNPTLEYAQLNTTFIKGPDGKMWATGVDRNTLFKFFGGIQPFTGARVANETLGLPQDILGNSVDPEANINLGKRNLQKMRESWVQPDIEDVLAAMKASDDRVTDAIRDIGMPDYEEYYKRGGYAYGSGGSGGGSSYARWSLMPFQNDMKGAYLDNTPNIYTNNPLIRRSDTRRQRFSTTRGRLNQWQ